MEDEHERVYQEVVAKHERYMEGAVPYTSGGTSRSLQRLGSYSRSGR